jgi:hypothetical protein
MQGAPPGMEAMLQNPDMMRNMSSMMANLTPEDMQRMSSMAGAFGGGGGGGGSGAGPTTFFMVNMSDKRWHQVVASECEALAFCMQVTHRI